jgi:hypothetical protein
LHRLLKRSIIWLRSPPPVGVCRFDNRVATAAAAAAAVAARAVGIEARRRTSDRITSRVRKTEQRTHVRVVDYGVRQTLTPIKRQLIRERDAITSCRIRKQTRDTGETIRRIAAAALTRRRRRRAPTAAHRIVQRERK